MTTVILQHYREGVAADATAVYLRNQAVTYGILNTATGIAAVAAGVTPLVSLGSGVYEYDASILAPGTYRAAFEQQNTAEPTRWDEINFTVEESVAALAGVKLADLERRLARRVGPFRYVQATSGTLLTVVANRIKTAIPVGGYDDLYILRRGVLSTGAPIANFNSDDRVRQVFSFAAVSGTLTADREWAIAPVAGEMIELHYLEPDEELRYALVEGLRRCFFTDAVTVSFAAAGLEQDLSTLMPWLSNPDWIKDVMWSYNASARGPIPMGWARPHMEGNSLMIRLGYDPYPNAVRFTVLRPVFSFVNGVTSLLGPNHDEDVVSVDVNYAVAAGHVEAWRNFPDKLMPAALNGLHPSLKEVAADFTVLSRTYGKYLGIGGRNRVQFSVPYGRQDSPVVNLG